MVNGAIVDLGKTFEITIQVVDCRIGATLAREQVQAEGREQVLNAVSKAAAGIRLKLGEPLARLLRLDASCDVSRARVPDLDHACAVGEDHCVRKLRDHRLR